MASWCCFRCTGRRDRSANGPVRFGETKRLDAEPPLSAVIQPVKPTSNTSGTPSGVALAVPPNAGKTWSMDVVFATSTALSIGAVWSGNAATVGDAIVL